MQFRWPLAPSPRQGAKPRDGYGPRGFKYAQESAQCTVWEGGVRTCSDCYKNKVLVGACVEAPSEVGHLTTKAKPLIEGRCGSYVFLTFDLNFGPSKR